MKILTKDDFQFNSNLKYYFYREEQWNIEVAIEPCFNGFDVGLYRLDNQMLIRDKECTNEDGYGSQEFIIKEIHNGPQERKPETWEHVLKLANKLYSSFMNYVQLRKMKFLTGVEGEEDIIYEEVKDKSSIHGLNPRGKI